MLRDIAGHLGSQPNGEGDVGTSVDGAVEEGAHERLVAPPEVVVDLVGATERVGDVHDEELVARRLHRLVGGQSHAGRAVGGDELLDVAGLRELDLAVLGLR